jgi:hypothetical protein
MKKAKKPLAVALYGMDDRAIKIMAMFLQGPCDGAAIIVENPKDADIGIFEGDAPASKKLLAKYCQENQQKPLIILSLLEVKQEGALHVKKPIDKDNMLLVLEQAKKLIAMRTKKTMLMSLKPEMAEHKVLDENLIHAEIPTKLQASSLDSLEVLGDWFDADWTDQ